MYLVAMMPDFSSGLSSVGWQSTIDIPESTAAEMTQFNYSYACMSHMQVCISVIGMCFLLACI